MVFMLLRDMTRWEAEEGSISAKLQQLMPSSSSIPVDTNYIDIVSHVVRWSKSRLVIETEVLRWYRSHSRPTLQPVCHQLQQMANIAPAAPESPALGSPPLPTLSRTSTHKCILFQINRKVAFQFSSKLLKLLFQILEASNSAHFPASNDKNCHCPQNYARSVTLKVYNLH